MFIDVLHEFFPICSLLFSEFHGNSNHISQRGAKFSVLVVLFNLVFLFSFNFMRFGKLLIETVPSNARNYCLAYNELKDMIRIACGTSKEVTIQDVTAVVGMCVHH
jgi:hypothetical protein